MQPKSADQVLRGVTVIGAGIIRMNRTLANCTLHGQKQMLLMFGAQVISR
ncbi:hypothetical protein RV14_GL000423 [Enterococcus ratti]|uniref:Uncharacterized protein n=1 Tax=Enterococcus ratti TaxID=150033 RepID=A0A1L8WIM5_9ENTE|nr:hypothetical protein RV14_GL000423 [Enterococcus ratti]